MKSPSFEDPGCMRFTSDAPHFFKIILEEPDRCEKLMIPKKFATRYRSDISSPVFLEVPSGALWKVELKTCADKTWLCNGWPEFAKDCSLGHGSFLVFRYEGNSHFHVIIFDKTASEIAYPYGRTHGKVLNSTGIQDDDDESVEILDEVPPSKKSPSLKGGHQDLMTEEEDDDYDDEDDNDDDYDDDEDDEEEEEEEEEEDDDDDDDDNSVELSDEVPPSKKTIGKSPSSSSGGHQDLMLDDDDDDDDSVEFLYEVPPSKKTRVKSPSTCSWPRKMTRSTSNIKPPEINSSRVKYEISQSEFNAKRSGKCSQQMEFCKRKRRLGGKERNKALLRACSFKSKNPSFKVVMQPSYVYDTCRMLLPVNFCMKYFPKHRGDAVLTVSDGKTWSVVYSGEIKPKLCRGWRKFVHENNLEVGDVCVFALINQTKITFQVEIFRAVQDANIAKGGRKERFNTAKKCCILGVATRKRAPEPTKSASAPQRFTSFKSKNPTFTITIQPTYARYLVNVPYSFVKEHIKLNANNVTLQVGNRLWPVKLLRYSRSKNARLGNGWGSFKRENSVKVGQVCVFELINKEDAVLRVHIS
ncbi:hypothetical protein SLEP1_g11958 [Rubroshorea leprosula]|nr:hypothetical protein SLEP1_g11958 [Rubroshorea leprosula]